MLRFAKKFKLSRYFVFPFINLILMGCGSENPPETVNDSSRKLSLSSLDSVASYASYGSDGNYTGPRFTLASVETYLKYLEATAGANGVFEYTTSDKAQNLSANIQQNVTQEVLNTFYANIYGPEVIDRILDKGIVVQADFRNQNCTSSALDSFINEDGTEVLNETVGVYSEILADLTAEGLDRVLDKGGIIEHEINGPSACAIRVRIVMASVETYLKFAEAAGLTGYGGAVPAYTPKANSYLLASLKINSCLKQI